MSIVRVHAYGIRYRVGVVAHLFSDHQSIVLTETREFRTLKAAERYQKRLTDRGRIAIRQVGVIQWMNDDEAIVELDRLCAAGGTLE